MTRVTQLIHDAGKYLLISVYPLPTHPTHNFTHNNGGNLETLPGWPKKLQHNRPARSAGQLTACEKLKMCFAYFRLDIIASDTEIAPSLYFADVSHMKHLSRSWIFGSVLVSCCAKIGTNLFFRKTYNCSGRLIGLPEDLLQLRKSYKCSGRLPWNTC